MFVVCPKVSLGKFIKRMLRNLTAICVLLALGLFSATSGQTTEGAVKPTVILGDVTAIDAAKMTVKVKDGSLDAVFSAKTEFKRVPAENPKLSAAVAAAIGDIAVGDRVAVTGILAADGKSIPARAVYLMTKSDISAKHAKESEEWKTRGIAGKVTAVNTDTHQITVEIRTLTGSTTTVITPKSSAKFLRYAPDSVEYDEAKQSSIAEVKPGDMVRALGDKSSDGASFAAEEVVSGAFQTTAGTVKSVDVEKNEIVVADLQTKKDVTIALGGASMLKKFPAEMAERLAGAQGGANGGNGGGMRPPGQGQAGPPNRSWEGNRPQGGEPGQAPNGRGFNGRGGGIDEMLERFPNITAADIKVGDMVAISSSKVSATTAAPARINAIKLLAGVEPFLRMAQTSNGRGRGQGVDTGFSIPGLDGVGFP